MNLDELYDDFILEDQDLRILKVFMSNKIINRDFRTSYDYSVFCGDAQDFAKLALSYSKSYDALPSRRTLCEISPNQKDFINFVCDKLDNLDINENDFEYDLKKIKDRYTKNRAISLRESLKNLSESDKLDSELQIIRREFDKISSIRTGKKKAYNQLTLKEYVPTFKTDYAIKSKDDKLGQGILTGYSFLDYVKNGMYPAELLIIGGETGSGKSILLNNMAIQMWMQNNSIYTENDFSKGCNVLYFSLEMPYEMCFRRTMARLADVPIYGLRDCKLNLEQIDRINQATNFISKFPYEFEIVDIPRGATVNEIENRYLEALSKGYRPDVVVVDYLGLMEDNEIAGEDWLKLGGIAGKLHEFGRIYETVVLTAVQLNRAPRTSNKDSSELVGMHRIGRSSLIMTHANVGIQLETRKDEHTYSDFIYHIIKNRDGEIGKHSLLKNFPNGSIIENPESSFFKSGPDDVGTFTSINDNNNISQYLKNIGWTA